MKFRNYISLLIFINFSCSEPKLNPPDCLGNKNETFDERIGNASSEKEEQRIVDSTMTHDPLNKDAIQHLLIKFQRNDRYESRDSLLNNLLIKYPDSAKSYFIYGRFRFSWPSRGDTSRLIYYNKALKIDPNSVELNKEMALNYYDWFLKEPMRKNASKARIYFVNLSNLDKSEIPFLKYPIIQLSNFLKDTSQNTQYRNQFYQVKTDKDLLPVGNRYNWYFPAETFLELTDNWENDFTKDLYIISNNSKFVQDWYASELSFFKEPILYTFRDATIYRFTLFASMEHPYTIKLKKENGEYTLKWKLSGYDFIKCKGILKTVGQKKINETFGEQFESDLKKIGYWQMPTNVNDSTQDTDGSQWILEATVNGKYHVVDRWSPWDTEFQKIIQRLIDASGLNKIDDNLN